MAKGKVVQVIGTVVDVEFPPEELPSIYDAVEVPVDGSKIVLEVQQHIGNNWARCLALTPTDGLKRGAEVADTGGPIKVPVGRECLGRLFNVFGEPLDNLGEVKAKEKWPIHRPPPLFVDLETRPQMLETGLKVIDLPEACCGLAGTYGFKREKYAVASEVGEEIFQSVRKARASAVISDCEACRMQIGHHTGVNTFHPIQILRKAYGE